MVIAIHPAPGILGTPILNLEQFRSLGQDRHLEKRVEDLRTAAICAGRIRQLIHNRRGGVTRPAPACCYFGIQMRKLPLQ
jgi:hypothetical protein